MNKKFVFFLLLIIALAIFKIVSAITVPKFEEKAWAERPSVNNIAEFNVTEQCIYNPNLVQQRELAYKIGRTKCFKTFLKDHNYSNIKKSIELTKICTNTTIGIIKAEINVYELNGTTTTKQYTRQINLTNNKLTC